MLEYPLDHGKIGGFVHGPTQAGVVISRLEITLAELPGIPQVGSHVLTVGRLHRLAPGLGKRSHREHFDIQAIGESGRRDIAQVVDAFGPEASNRLVHQRRIDQGAITGDAYHHVGG